MKVYTYGATSEKFLGKFQTTIERKNKVTKAPIFIAKSDCRNLPSYEISGDIQVIHEINTIQSGKVNELCSCNESVFPGIGRMKDTKVDSLVHNNVQPVTQPHRKKNYHFTWEVENELKRSEKMGIIEKVDCPTDWVYPIYP